MCLLWFLIPVALPFGRATVPDGASAARLGRKQKTLPRGMGLP